MKNRSKIIEIYFADSKKEEFTRVEEYIFAIKKGEKEIDEKELIKLFQACSEILILNEISLLFMDFRIDAGAPFIFKKLKDEKYAGKSGTLIYALNSLNFDFNNYILDIVQIILNGSLEAREMAQNLIEKSSHKLSLSKRMEAIKLLEGTPSSNSDNDKFKRSNYIDYVIDVLRAK